jgi:hypothetical protein
MKSIVALAAAVGAVAVLPAGASAAPPPLCVETTQGAICASDAGQIVSDPGGFAHHLVCDGDTRICPPPDGTRSSWSPPPACFESPQFAICSDEVGPLVGQTLADPAATAQLLVTIAHNVVCYGNDICSLISTG